MSDIIQILRNNHQKKNGGISLKNNVSNDVIAVVEKGNKQKFIVSDSTTKTRAIDVPNSNYAIYPHIPLGRERYIIFFSGEGGMGKSSMTSLLIKQTYQHITKRIYYICGTDIKSDISIAPLKYIKQIPGDQLGNINVETDLEDSLIVFDDIDNWEYHKEAIKILNKSYEVGRKFGINIIYISHITSKANESKIYGEVNMYITNKARNNRMFETHLGLDKNIIEEMHEILKTDIFVAYNKTFNSVITDKKVFKVEY